MPRREPLDVRLWRYLAWDGECLVWMAPVNSDGYGTIGTGDKKTDKAQRVFWKLYRGPIPTGAYVLHNCPQRNKRCVVHTYLGTHRQNMQDAARDGIMAKRPQVWGNAKPVYSWKGKHRTGLRGKMVR